MQAGEHYMFGNAYGSPFFEASDDGGTLEVPSVFIAHRQAASDITDEGGRRGGGSVEFREPGTNEIINDRVQVNYPFAPDTVQKGGYFDAPSIEVIQKSFIMLNVFIGLRDAVSAFHEGGDVQTIIAGLIRMEAALIDYNVEVADEDIDYDVALDRQLIDVMEENGIEPPVEVEIPEDVWEQWQDDQE